MNLWDITTQTAYRLPRCPWCGEPVSPRDERANNCAEPTHFECALRSVVGGLNHLRGACSCCGGKDDPDPPGMTRREAARAAANEYLSRLDQ